MYHFFERRSASGLPRRKREKKEEKEEEKERKKKKDPEIFQKSRTGGSNFIHTPKLDHTLLFRQMYVETQSRTREIKGCGRKLVSALWRGGKRKKKS